MTRAWLLVAVLLATVASALVVTIVEVPDADAKPADLAYIVDGDTVRLRDGTYVRLVGYNAYELAEPLGRVARFELQNLCRGQAYLDVDDYEPRDRHGRILGYLWCRQSYGNTSWHLSVQRYFIVVRPGLVKELLYIPPDEHPYAVWQTRHVVVFNAPVKVVVYNSTSPRYLGMVDRVVLLGGVYEVYVDGRRIATLNLLIEQPRVVTLNVTNNATSPAPPMDTNAAVQTVTETVTVTTTATITATTTVTQTATVIATITERVVETVTVPRTVTETTTVTTTVIHEKASPYQLLAVVLAVAALAVATVVLARRR